jgi:hypothetical protein
MKKTTTASRIDRKKPARRKAAPAPSTNGVLAGLLEQATPAAAPAPAIGGRQPTAEQAAILAAASGLAKDGVLIIEAGAGTGKTTTLGMLEQILPGIGQYTAFNAALVKESGSKFKKASCNTTHSLAFRAVGKKFAHRLNGPRVRGDAVARTLELGAWEYTVETGDGPQTRTMPAGFCASQVIGAIKRFCQSADREIAAEHFRYLDGIDRPGEDGRRTYANNGRLREHLLPFARKAWADLSSPDGTLPFAHDHYVKVWQLDNPVISADYILLDEAQDTAPVMLDILKQQAALVILVGDSAQQIYEWRGAVNAMGAYPDAPRQMLSQSFRFGEAVAELANKVLDQLEEKTPLRLKGLPSIPSRIEPLARPGAVLCRTNGAAIQHLLLALADGRAPFLVGGGSDVIAFVDAAKALQDGRGTGHPELACFASWSEVQDYVKQDEGEDLKLMVKLIDQFGPEVILDALRRMPAEKDADVVISTAHKAKGREWDEVKLASDFPTLSKSCDADLKLLYVALTRAKLVLDVSECPFFTGQDALPFEIVNPAKPAGEDGIAPPTPSAPPTPQAYTWCKFGREDRWHVRGPAGGEGKLVEVTRRDGSTSKKRLGKQVWEGDGAAIYQV